MLQQGKELTESFQSQKLVDDQLKVMKETGIQLAENLVCKDCVVTNCMDGKALNLFLGIGGAYCDLCSVSRSSCHSLAVVEAGYLIDRDVNTMHEIFKDLYDPDVEAIKKLPNYGLDKPINQYQKLKYTQYKFSMPSSDVLTTGLR